MVEKHTDMEEKTQQIKQLTNYLINKYGSANILVTDYWDADLCAIGLSDKTKQFTLYISHWKNPKDKFFVSLQSPPVAGDEQYSDAGNFDNLTADEVEKIAVEHLKLT